MTQRKGWSGRRVAAVAVVLALIPILVIAGRGRRVLIDGDNDEWLPFGEMPLDLVGDQFSQDTGQPAPDNILLPMTLRIGTQTFDRLWINENGFVSLTSAAGAPPSPTQAADAGSLADIPGDVIAVFYADIVSRPLNGCTQPRFNQCSDISWAALDLDENSIDPNDPPPFMRGARVTWGDPGSGPTPPGVVVREGSAVIDETKRGAFQIRLIDRSTPQTSGDFDLEFNYNAVPWQDLGIVGIKAGGVELDFARFYSSFYDNNPSRITDENDSRHPCFNAGAVDPSFVTDVPFFCNNITISFRSGVANLRGYSADVSGTVTAPATVTANAGETFSFDVTLRNDDYDDATNVTTEMNMPAGWSFVSATPGTLCELTGGELSCNHGSLSSGASTAVGLTLRSTAAGASSPVLRFGADQFDPVPTNNERSLAATISPTADLSVTGCSAPSSATSGATVSVSCTVRNDGPQNATNVVLTAQLNSAVTFQSGTSCSAAGATVTCQKASIAANSTSDFSMTLNAAAAGSGNIALTVDAAEHDPTQNNSHSVAVSISTSTSGGGGGGGGGSISLLMLALLGLLPRARKSRWIARPTTGASANT